jgi:L-fucose isomerase-like protein
MTCSSLKVALLVTNFPGAYFPERHGVFDAARTWLDSVAQTEGIELACDTQVLSDRGSAEAAIRRVADADFVLVLHGGFTMGDVAHALSASDLRLGFWAVPEPTFTGDIQLNNFVSLNMSLSIAAMTRDTRTNPVAWYFGAPGSPHVEAPLTNTLRALKLQKALTGRKIGCVGGVAPTFYNMELDRGALFRAWGTIVDDLPISYLRGAACKIAARAVDDEVARMAAAARVDGVSGAQMALSARYALAIRQLAETNGWSSAAVRDWPEVLVDPGFHPGAAFSWAEESYRLPVASEGDVLGALTQLAALALTGKVGCVLDLCAPDVERGRLLVWHGGGGPLHLADASGARWIMHPMIGRTESAPSPYGTVADYVFAPGPVTLARIGNNGRTVFAIEATIAAGDVPGFDGERGWATDFSQLGNALSLWDVMETIMSYGAEHHFVLIPGRHSATFAELATWSGAHFLKARRHEGYLAPHASAFALAAGNRRES